MTFDIDCDSGPNMSSSEFDSIAWSSGMSCNYHGRRFAVESVDFVERLIGISIDDGEPLTWVRCENVSNVTLSADQKKISENP